MQLPVRMQQAARLMTTVMARGAKTANALNSVCAQSGNSDSSIP